MFNGNLKLNYKTENYLSRPTLWESLDYRLNYFTFFLSQSTHEHCTFDLHPQYVWVITSHALYPEPYT